MMKDLEEISYKLMNEVHKSIQGLDEKSRNLDEKFSKEIEIQKKVGNFKMQGSINQINISVESITNRLDQAKERIAGIEDKVEKLNNKEKLGCVQVFSEPQLLIQCGPDCGSLRN
jgi:hypothetical protein